MVKCTLSGKQTTTRAMGAKIAQWIIQAGCGVMARIRGYEVAIVSFELREVFPGTKALFALTDIGGVFCLDVIRIHRATVSQIRGLINV